MSNAADKKRWAILPPPSSNSAKISGEFALEEMLQRRRPARQTVSGALQRSGSGAPVHSSVQELEPSDSERVTEVPDSDEPVTGAFPRSDLSDETIPAPPLPDDE